MKKQKKARQREQITPDDLKKWPRSSEGESFLSKTPSWTFKKCDKEEWPLPQGNELYDLLLKLSTFEGLTWGEILKASGGRSHGTNNHYENVEDLIDRAQKRLIELKMDDIDRVFSLRLQGAVRLYGILEDGIFSLLWYDPDHEIYPTKD